MGRARALAGVIGPAAFTAAWLVAQRRQDEYEVAHEHISGLAALDANDPHVMTAGFLALGACTVAFASELDRRLAARGRSAGWGPALIGTTGLTTVAAGAFRRDRRSNVIPPGLPPGQSWVNDVHDAAAVVGGVAGAAGLLALAWRFARDPEWEGFALPAVSAAVAGSGLTGVFLRDVVRPGNGIVQRASVSIPLAFMSRLSLRLLREDPSGERSTASVRRPRRWRR
jgi:hypothetical protein